MAQTGRYIHDADAVWEKRFSKEDGRYRTFKILISTAYNAGIIGSEYNGVVVLDEDLRRVVADRECCGSGLRETTQQRELAASLCNAPDWSSFAALVRGLHSFRAHEEFSCSEPNWFAPLPEADNWKFEPTPEQVGPADDPVVFSSLTRKDIIQELVSHSMHRDGYRPFRLAWNVKLYSGIDTSGKREGYAHDDAHDALWETHLEKDGNGIFERIIEDMRRPYEESDFSGCDCLPCVTVGFEGRSAGWLVLDKIEGLGRFSWEGAGEMEVALYEMSKDDLFALYRVVCTLDRNLSTSRLLKSASDGYAFERETMGEEFDETLAREYGWEQEEGRIFRVQGGEPCEAGSWRDAVQISRGQSVVLDAQADPAAPAVASVKDADAGLSTSSPSF